jgi:hypothetical protein
MNLNVTLTAQQFTQLHNALCSLRSVHEQLSSVLNKQLSDPLIDAINEIDQSLVTAYAAEDMFVDNQMNYFEQVAAEQEFGSVWSLWEVRSMTDAHPYVGATEISYTVLHQSSQCEVRTAIRGNTWLDLWRAADRAIQASGDEHLIFIEDFEQEGQVLRLSTGS